MTPRLVDDFPLRTLWIVPLCVVVAVLVGVYLSGRQKPLYRASATMVVVPDVTSSKSMIDGLETLERRTVVATLARIPPALETRTKAARLIELPADESGRYRVEAMVLPNTNAIRVEVTGPEAERVAALANAVAAATDSTARELYRLFKLELLAAATVPRSPFHPDPARNYVVAGILGLFVGLLATGAVGFLHQRARLAARE
jgi:capsular polysaccharide biosynthesis protein